MRSPKTELIANCQTLIQAYKSGDLGVCELPEDLMPKFQLDEQEEKLTYFTLPMALNYHRNSTQLWRAALASYEDSETRPIFSVPSSASMTLHELQKYLLKYKVAMQPTRHTLSWHVIAQTLNTQWGSIGSLLESADYDYLQLKQLVQKTHKKGFPYLSGPKLFNYWCFIMDTKCDMQLKNKEFIDIAVDSHVLKCSVRLDVIDEQQALKMSGEQIAQAWRTQLLGSGIAPTELNVPLWFWSRNGFVFEP